MNLDICMVVFNDINLPARYSEKIRGYLGNKYKDIEVLHNHLDDKFIYRYPIVQYKVLNEVPIIIGINEAANLVASIGVTDDKLIIDEIEYDTFKKQIIKTSISYGYTEDYIEYEFLTPWIALNQKNSLEYLKSNSVEREEILKRILIGNIISMSKGLGYTVNEKVDCYINLKEKEVRLKGIKHIAFTGKFKINFNIPDYLGIGKGVSKGFGTVKNINI